jgi:hypothetical protein
VDAKAVEPLFALTTSQSASRKKVIDPDCVDPVAALAPRRRLQAQMPREARDLACCKGAEVATTLIKSSVDARAPAQRGEDAAV